MFREMRSVLISLIISSVSILIYGSDYRVEADVFLKNMPDSLQSIQTRAIRKAMAGDSKELQLVRKSRNSSAEMPKNVIAEYITPNLRLYKPIGKNVDRLPLLVYFHGGGWTFGSINSCSKFCANLVSKGNAMVLAVDYRLAPEHPFPQGLEDCCNAVMFAVENADKWGGDSDCISLGGDSSGGNLAIATALKLQKTMPDMKLRSLVLFYPVVSAWIDKTDSWNKYGEGFGLDSELMNAFNRAYAGNDYRNPLISVSLADDKSLKKLPPTLLIAADRDILKDQGEKFCDKLKTLGVDVTRKELSGTVHLFITVPGQNSAFQEAVSISSDFLSRQ